MNTYLRGASLSPIGNEGSPQTDVLSHRGKQRFRLICFAEYPAVCCGFGFISPLEEESPGDLRV